MQQKFIDHLNLFIEIVHKKKKKITIMWYYVSVRKKYIT